MRPKVDKDLELAALASAQHGVVGSRQLLALGLSAQSIKRRVRRGRLHPIHRGVYAVGHTVLTVEGRWMATTLATGGVLSHATAASAWDLRPSRSGLIHVTVGTAGRVGRRGIRLHRSSTLGQHEIATHRGIPLTTPLRTIIDLASTLNGRPLEHVLDLADQRGLIDFNELAQRPIPTSLQAVLALYNGTTPTRSELEERFLQLCDDHGIPRPETNAIVEGHEVDFVWRTKRLIVEVDGYAYHRSPSAFERDRERDVVLTMRGWRVRRFTWAQVTRRQAWVARALDM
jgi:predicted transcriptional regulator of viral defense system